jgi:hypothetical protein
MTPKDKAKELISIYWNTKVETPHVRESIMSKELATKCALIAVDELIYETQFEVPNIRQIWWIEVKKEIENL